MGCSITQASSGCSVCAERAMRRYLGHQPSRNVIPLYIFSTGQFLTRDKVISILHLQLLCHRAICIPQFPHWGCNYSPAIATPGASEHWFQYTDQYLPRLPSWERNGTTEHSFYQLAYLGHNLGAHPPHSYHSRHAG